MAFDLMLTDYSMPHILALNLPTRHAISPSLACHNNERFLNEEAFRNMPVGLAPVFHQKPFSIQDLVSSIDRPSGSQRLPVKVKPILFRRNFFSTIIDWSKSARLDLSAA